MSSLVTALLPPQLNARLDSIVPKANKLFVKEEESETTTLFYISGKTQITSDTRLKNGILRIAVTNTNDDETEQRLETQFTGFGSGDLSKITISEGEAFADANTERTIEASDITPEMQSAIVSFLFDVLQDIRKGKPADFGMLSDVFGEIFGTHTHPPAPAAAEKPTLADGP